jgi:hypothetical protein
VHGTVVLPSSALVELAIRAGDEIGLPRLAALDVHRPVAVPRRGIQLQVRVRADAVTIHTRLEGEWTLNASGTLAPGRVPDWPDTGEWQELPRTEPDGFRLHPSLLDAAPVA